MAGPRDLRRLLLRLGPQTKPRGLPELGTSSDHYGHAHLMAASAIRLQPDLTYSHSTLVSGRLGEWVGFSPAMRLRASIAPLVFRKLIQYTIPTNFTKQHEQA